MCLLHRDFAPLVDKCMRSPLACSDGLSFSVWYKARVDERLIGSNRYVPRQALISTGGDIQGTPGLMVYIQNEVLGAIVSTGLQYWKVAANGMVINNAWNNVGVRWRVPVENSSHPVQGLELFINQEKVASMIYGISTTSKTPLEPIQLMVGCHKTSTYGLYTGFCPCEIDEIAIWGRALRDDETSLFIGGYRSSLSAPDFLRILSRVNLRDTEQQAEAIEVLERLLARAIPSEDEADRISHEDRPTPEEEAEEMATLAEIVDTMTDPRGIRPRQTRRELALFANLITVPSLLLNSNAKAKWESLKRRKTQNEPQKKPHSIMKKTKESTDLVHNFETWALASATRVPLSGPNDTLLVAKRTGNIELTIQKIRLDAFKRKPVASFPAGTGRKTNSIQIPTGVFNKAGCDRTRLQIVFAKYKTLGDVAPNRLRKKGETAGTSEELIVVDTPVVSLRIGAGEDLDQERSPCIPTPAQLEWAPIVVTLSHKTPTKTLRKPLFHTEVKTDIVRRICAWWNPQLRDDVGGWDPAGCRAVESNEFFTKCACHNFGQYAVLNEKVEPKRVPVEAPAAKYIKYLLYTASIFMLLFFIFVFCQNNSLHDMFHGLRVHTALLLLAAALCQCLSDQETTRQSRHHCTALGCCIQFTYTAATVALACEGYANFRAVIDGCVSGKYRTFIAFTYGIPCLLVGFTLVSGIDNLGDDPRCMIGWAAWVKSRFFLAPLLLVAAVALTGAAVARCNSRYARARPELVLHQRSIANGHGIFCIIFTVSWVIGMLCYVTLANDDSLVAGVIYSLFQTLLALHGVLFFVLMGFLSNRFHAVLPCTKNRQELALSSLDADSRPTSGAAISRPDSGSSVSRPPSEDSESRSASQATLAVLFHSSDEE